MNIAKQLLFIREYLEVNCTQNSITEDTHKHKVPKSATITTATLTKAIYQSIKTIINALMPNQSESNNQHVAASQLPLPACCSCSCKFFHVTPIA